MIVLHIIPPHELIAFSDSRRDLTRNKPLLLLMQDM